MPDSSQIVTVLCYLCAALGAQIRLADRQTNIEECSRCAVSSPFLCVGYAADVVRHSRFRRTFRIHVQDPRRGCPVIRFNFRTLVRQTEFAQRPTSSRADGRGPTS